MMTSTILLYLLVLSITVTTVYSQCGGTALVLTANSTYQNFTSPNYPTSYSNQQSCEWRIEADDSSHAIRLEVFEADIEYHAKCVNDYGEVFDGDNVNATSLGTFCGTSTPNYVTTDSNMTVTFISDYSVTRTGFAARYISGPRSSLLDDEEEAKGIMLFIIIGAASGVVVILIVTLIVCHKWKKSKRAREKQACQIEVQPFHVASKWSTRNRGIDAPPMFGNGGVSTLSPPPRYSDVGLHPTPGNAAGQTDGVPNTRFVVPENFRMATTQIGGTTNGVLPNGNAGVVTTNITSNTQSDPLPNDNNSPENPTVPPLNLAGQSSSSPVPAPAPAPVLTNQQPPLMPRRNVPGQTLSEALSSSDDDSDTDSDDSFDYIEA
ncbi:uncharacterized protein LOC132712950 [Ruditapes philippinarum]|uniref:uncharacterized protein LOC132712950 n=1 Tax=Ruditapes philippinarum TaxID=129788 RepID=UPI00295C26A1|nr:uncharacterized protein LOC132712950 [Ruditapes philippinarum]